MKFSSPIFFSLLALPLVQGNFEECVTYEAGVDYFPNKVQPEQSQYWSVTYENSYKIVENAAMNKTYLLYQCGTPSPENQTGYDAVLSVPIQGFGLQSTTFIPFVELLGLRTNITAFFGSASWVYSPCLKTLFDNNDVVSLEQPSNVSLINELGLSLDLPSFVNFDSAFENNIHISASEEDFNLAVYEWIKFYSLFFNREKEANEAFEGTSDRYECAKENAASLAVTDDKKPVVLWGSYTNWCTDANGETGAFDVARSCPEYYCEFAESCSADLLTSLEGSFESPNCGRNYMNITEFIEYGKDADVWVYTSPDVQSWVYGAYKDELKDFKSVKNKQVYSIRGDIWFEQRLAEPDTILQDFCSIVGHSNNAFPHKQVFLRNVFDSEPDTPICADPAAPLETLGSQCGVLADTTEPPSAATTGSGPQTTTMSPSAAPSVHMHEHDGSSHDGSSHYDGSSHDDSAASQLGTGLCAFAVLTVSYLF